MKSFSSKNVLRILLILPGFIFLFNSCEPLATSFKDVEDAVMYTKDVKISPPVPDSTIKVMTWNIRFGIGRQPWFGDACGDNTVFKKEEVMPGLEAIVARIEEVKPDILFLQECDVKSNRTAYINELQYILDNTYFNYAAYVSEWKSEFIPSDGLGRMDMGLVILSPWPINDAKRINLATRGDQAGIVNYFYLHSCIVTGTVKIPGFKEIPLLNIHASAFATDDTKKKHFEEFKSEMDKLDVAGRYFIAGGDLNELPPGSDSTDYCYIVMKMPARANRFISRVMIRNTRTEAIIHLKQPGFSQFIQLINVPFRLMFTSKTNLHISHIQHDRSIFGIVHSITCLPTTAGDQVQRLRTRSFTKNQTMLP
jgi:endonuclease/exonuclease/phosphatase family metal-dependent hydrolase